MAIMTRCPSCETVLIEGEERCASCGFSNERAFNLATVIVLLVAVVGVFWQLTR